MDRRTFLRAPARFVSGESLALGASHPRTLSSSLAPYVPSQTMPWDAVRAGHLLRRTTFLPRWADIAALLAMTPSEAVDLLLNTVSSPAQPTVADHGTESLDGLDQISRNQVQGQWKSDAAVLRKWWSDTMRDAPLSIAEKLTLFWSGHFTTEFAVDDFYVVAPLLYRQNKLFREHGLGNFKDLVMSVTLDPAMLVYLGGNLNSKGHPNENYGRELMELFTMGLGWYTEGDVQNAARILTGWRVSQYTDKPFPNGLFATYYDRTQHDLDAKEFLGVSFPARGDSINTEDLVRRDEVRKLVDTIFEKRAQETARFIARKIYRFFVYSSPTASDESVISEMASLFISSDFEIRPVIAALLKSEHFFDNANLGAQIKTPAEYTVGIARQLYAKQEIDATMTSMGQQLFDPPDVSGWPGHHDWITTTSFPVRADVADKAVTAMTEAELIALIKSLPSFETAQTMIDELAAMLLPRPLAVERRAALIQKLSGGAPAYEWPNIVANDEATAARNMRETLRAMIQLPDFQLC